jgi:hypothetical protein
MRSIVIVLFDPACDAAARFLHVAILRRPHLFFLQAAMEPFDVAVALRMVIRRPAMRDTEPVQCLDKACRSELCAVVRGESHTGLTTSLGKPLQYGLFDRIECFLGSATMDRFQLTISRVQQSITLTKYAQPTVGPAQILVMSDCQI